MDLDRFKKKQVKQPVLKRSVNGGEKVSFGGPAIIKPTANTRLEAEAPSVHQKHTGSLFDEDDDIFGVWNKQKEIKHQQKLEEKAKKAAKKALKEQKRLEKQQLKAKRKANGDPRKLELSLTMPSSKKGLDTLNNLKGAVDYRPNHKKYYIAGTVLVGLPLVLIGFGVMNHITKPKSNPSVQGATAQASTKPDFSTLKPTTTDNQATTIKYDTTKKVASYNDVLNDVPITVSQQPLPSGFVSDPTGKVADLAKQINANDKISTSDTTAYAGLSIKGPQTVVFTKNDLLIFIYADKKIDVLTWTKYIESMQTK